MLKSQKSGRRRVRLYNLRRTAQETQINDYNAALLLYWGANVDVQFIGMLNIFKLQHKHYTYQHNNLGENQLVVNRYIGNYMGKAEKNETEDLWSSLSNAQTLRGRLKSFAIRSFRNREVGLYECADR